MKITETIITSEDVIDFMHTFLPYEQNLVYVIDKDGRDHLVSSPADLHALDHKTIKIEGMERYNESVWDFANFLRSSYGHNGPVTCHAFLAETDSPSFPEHTDPDDVVIMCCSGTKTLEVNNKIITLERGDTIFIPRNTPHRALNTEGSLVLSVGMERFLVDKQREEH